MAVLFAVSCATGPSVPTNVEEPLVTRDAYTIEPGDELEVVFTYWPELTATQTVRSDGKISLRYIDDVAVAGLEPEVCSETLNGLYEDILNNPDIKVVLRAENRHVYVGGEVRLSSSLNGLYRVPLVGKLTPMEAIMQAGGFTKASAKLSNVLIIRRFDDKRYARTVDLRRNFKDAEGAPFYLEPNDIVFVPRTKIDRINQWVEQFIDKIFPRGTAIDLIDLLDIDEDTSVKSTTYSVDSTAVELVLPTQGK